MIRPIVTSLMVLLALEASALAGSPEVKWEKRGSRWEAEVTHSLQGASFKKLNVSGFTGNVTVTGNTKDAELVIRCVMERGLSREEAEEVLKKILPQVKISSREVEVQSSRRYVWGTPDANLSLNARIPIATDLYLKVSAGDADVSNLKGTINCVLSGGSVDLSNVEGNLSTAVSGGDLTFNDVRGELSAATSGGDIKLEKYSGTADVTTSGGNISIRRVKGTLTATTSGGDIQAIGISGDKVILTSSGGDLDLEDIAVTRHAELETSGGSIGLRNSSGTMRVSSSGGDVDLQKHEGEIEINANSGDVVLKEVRGSVTANVGSGDIQVWLVEGLGSSDRVELWTNDGSLELHIPSTMGAYIEASVEIYSDSDKRDRIESDFPLKYKHAKRGELRASGEINGGGIPILLTVGNGYIRIRSQ
ncbi:MAG: DUF4097 family beta strand repeat-containing protein [bacterium]